MLKIHSNIVFLCVNIIGLNAEYSIGKWLFIANDLLEGTSR
jgi:hypothetical protein